jgi:hypothetical protein
MLKVIINCSVCGTKLAEIKKGVFRPHDFNEYRESFACDCGAPGEPTEPVEVEE